MSSNVGSINSAPLVGAFQYNPYAMDGFDEIDMTYNSPLAMGGSIFDGSGYGGFGMGMMPMPMAGGGVTGYDPKSYFNNMKDYQKFYIDYNVDQQNMQRNADLRINASLEGIKDAAAVLRDKIKQNEQDQVPAAFKAYVQSVGAAYGEGSGKEVEYRALSLYEQMTGKSLIQDLRDNGHSSFTQGLLQSLTFSATYRTSAEDNISAITGQPVGTSEKVSQGCGKVLGAGTVGAALGALAGKLSHSGKVGTIVGLAAAGLSAVLAFVTGGKG